MSDKSKIEWTAGDDGTPGATWNPVTGCTKVSSGCDHCLVPETRILRADMTWVPISEIQVGDRLVAFTEEPGVGQNRVWEESVVEAKWETEKPTVEVELAGGATFTASEDHRWLVAQRSASAWWRTTLRLSFGTSVRIIRCEPTDTEATEYQAGYIAGATTGDGAFRWDPAWRSDKLGDPQSYWRVAKPESDRAVLDRLAAYLLRVSIEVNVRPFDAGASAFTSTPAPMAKVETRKLADMPVIAAMCEERPAREWQAGWLAGLFDTDSSYSGGNLRFCQSKPNDVLERVSRYAKELGFNVRSEHFEGAECPTARLYGGIAENVAFLAAISPALTRRCRDFYGKRIETPAHRVVGIHRGPARRLIDITTSTRTFIAEGALTHNCYAETFAERWRGTPGHHFENGFDLTLRPERVDQPLRWKRPKRIFVNSMSDLFHESVPDAFIAEVFSVMARAHWHTFQLLTKRHGRMKSLLSRPSFRDNLAHWASWPLPNVWLGVSAEDQKWFDIRVPALLETPAAMRFVSCEPLLGWIDMAFDHECGDPPHMYCPPVPDWVIIGGESGSGARPMDLEWAREIVKQCRWSGIPPFVKQLGSIVGHEAGAGPKGGDWDRWPEDLKVREFPRDVSAGAQPAGGPA